MKASCFVASSKTILQFTNTHPSKRQNKICERKSKVAPRNCCALLSFLIFGSRSCLQAGYDLAAQAHSSLCTRFCEPLSARQMLARFRTSPNSFMELPDANGRSLLRDGFDCSLLSCEQNARSFPFERCCTADFQVSDTIINQRSNCEGVGDDGTISRRS